MYHLCGSATKKSSASFKALTSQWTRKWKIEPAMMGSLGCDAGRKYNKTTRNFFLFGDVGGNINAYIPFFTKQNEQFIFSFVKKAKGSPRQSINTFTQNIYIHYLLVTVSTSNINNPFDEKQSRGKYYREVYHHWQLVHQSGFITTAP